VLPLLLGEGRDHLQPGEVPRVVLAGISSDEASCNEIVLFFSGFSAFKVQSDHY